MIHFPPGLLENLFYFKGCRGMPWKLVWIPLLHIVKELAFGMVLDVSLDLVRFAFLGDEKQRSLAAGQDVGLRLVEEIVRYNQYAGAELSNTGGIDRVWSTLWINGGEYNWPFAVLPCFIDNLSLYCLTRSAI